MSSTWKAANGADDPGQVFGWCMPPPVMMSASSTPGGVHGGMSSSSSGHRQRRTPNHLPAVAQDIEGQRVTMRPSADYELKVANRTYGSDEKERRAEARRLAAQKAGAAAKDAPSASGQLESSAEASSPSQSRPPGDTSKGLTGVVKIYFASKGFGFLSHADHPGDIYFHSNSLPADASLVDLVPGRHVFFDMRIAPDGRRQAKNMQLADVEIGCKAAGLSFERLRFSGEQDGQSHQCVGRVVNYYDHKGFGYIRSDDLAKDIIFYRQTVQGCNPFSRVQSMVTSSDLVGLQVSVEFYTNGRGQPEAWSFDIVPQAGGSTAHCVGAAYAMDLPTIQPLCDDLSDGLVSLNNLQGIWFDCDSYDRYYMVEGSSCTAPCTEEELFCLSPRGTLLPRGGTQCGTHRLHVHGSDIFWGDNWTFVLRWHEMGEVEWASTSAGSWNREWHRDGCGFRWHRWRPPPPPPPPYVSSSFSPLEGADIPDQPQNRGADVDSIVRNLSWSADVSGQSEADGAAASSSSSCEPEAECATAQDLEARSGTGQLARRGGEGMQGADFQNVGLSSKCPYTFGVVVGEFDPSEYGSDYMLLEVGDVIKCISEAEGWWFGKRVDPDCLSSVLAEGWFPPTFIERQDRLDRFQ